MVACVQSICSLCLYKYPQEPGPCVIWAGSGVSQGRRGAIPALDVFQVLQDILCPFIWVTRPLGAPGMLTVQDSDFRVRLNSTSAVVLLLMGKHVTPGRH